MPMILCVLPVIIELLLCGLGSLTPGAVSESGSPHRLYTTGLASPGSTSFGTAGVGEYVTIQL